MVEIHRLSFNATKALLKAKGIRLPHNEMVVVARVYLAGFREALLREAIGNLQRWHWRGVQRTSEL
jgi:hypothetical protein